jgi:cell division protein FtsB
MADILHTATKSHNQNQQYRSLFLTELLFFLVFIFNSNFQSINKSNNMNFNDQIKILVDRIVRLKEENQTATLIFVFNCNPVLAID